MAINLKDIIPSMEMLVGRTIKGEISHDVSKIKIFREGGIGYSQFNEILLLCGFNRCNHEFFQFIVDGTFEYQRGASIKDLAHFKSGISRFMKASLLQFGNIRYAYKQISNDSATLWELIRGMLPIEIEEFKHRHQPIWEIVEIPPDKTYYLGYIIESEITKMLNDNPNNENAISMKAERERYLETAKNNQKVYLSSDHLDVYVATSMRAKHEFLFVNKTVDEVFGHPKLADLNLRYFDPTQAYCDNRIDKGLSEALMLKTALCTLYLAQETETLGKDSELASTLAQGKAVIAYIPRGNKRYIDNLLLNLKNLSQGDGKSEVEIIIEQLMVFDSSLAWKDKHFRKLIDKPSTDNIDALKEKLYNIAESFYDKKAKTLSDYHPLGIQVNLATGVANGVLVVRTIEDCVELIKNIALNEMQFELVPDPEKKEITQNEYIYLKEKISNCIFRVKTGDRLLTNTFWNFYN